MLLLLLSPLLMMTMIELLLLPILTLMMTALATMILYTDSSRDASQPEYLL